VLSKLQKPKKLFPGKKLSFETLVTQKLTFLLKNNVVATFSSPSWLSLMIYWIISLCLLNQKFKRTLKDVDDEERKRVKLDFNINKI